MNAQTTAVAPVSNHPIAKLSAQLEERAAQFKNALPSHISPEKLQRTIITAAQSNPSILRADRQSLIVAAMKAAQDGLLPDGREAALVPFKNRVKVGNDWEDRWEVQYMPMIYGLRKKILQSGEIRDFTTKVVYRREVEEGRFVYEEGTEAALRHKPMLELTGDDTTDDKICLAYSVATFSDGSKSYEVMRRFEIDKVRECSQTGATKDRYGKARTPKGPWVDWFPEQCKKTVARRHSKTLPMSGDIFQNDPDVDDTIAASRAAQVLDSIEPDAPVALPSNEKLDQSARPSISEELNDAIPNFDEQTGEVIDNRDSRGMTEVDETTARAADAGDDQRSAGDPEDEKPAWWDKVEAIRNGIAEAKTAAQIKTFDNQFIRIRAGLPDEVCDELDAAIAAARAALGQPKEG